MWEDAANKKGGRWIIELEKNSFRTTTDLDFLWLEMVLCMIGEGFDEYSNEICGAVINIRKQCDKISLWTGNANRKEGVIKIG